MSIDRIAGELPQQKILSYVFNNGQGHRFIFLIRQGRKNIAKYLGGQSAIPGNPYQLNDAVRMSYYMDTEPPCAIADIVKGAKEHLLTQYEGILKPH